MSSRTVKPSRVLDDYNKRKVALRYWMLGAGFHDASLAMDYAESFHQGTRKDGITPEFSHQVAIASYLRTLLPHLLFPQESLTTAFLHDVREDYDVSDQEIRGGFGDTVADSVNNMTKVYRGEKRDAKTLFGYMSTDPVASIVKLADRIHNQDTLVGVFDKVKMEAYLNETYDLFFPMLKAARRSFPSQEPAYENAKLVLTTQCKLIEGIIDGLNDTSPPL